MIVWLALRHLQGGSYVSLERPPPLTRLSEPGEEEGWRCQELQLETEGPQDISVDLQVVST